MSYDAKPAGILERISHRAAKQVRVGACAMKNSAPLVSFTFDDCPESAFEHGHTVLQRFGLCGTFYIASALIGRRFTQWTVIDEAGVKALADAGHEIGLHSHAHDPAGMLSAASFKADLEHNRDVLSAIVPDKAFTNYAYPYGRATLMRKRQLGELVRSSRSVIPGINAGMLDPHYLLSVELRDPMPSREDIAAFLAETRGKNGWLIFMTHDVAPNPDTFGCTPEQFSDIVEQSLEAGLTCLTVDQALDSIGVPAFSPETAMAAA